MFLWHINHCRLFNAKSIFIHINSSISNNSVWRKWIFFAYKLFNVKTVLFQEIQFTISTRFISVWPIYRTLSGATSRGQSGPGSNGNKEVLHISQKLQHYKSLTIRLFSVISRTLVGGSYLSAQMQLVYSKAGDWKMCQAGNEKCPKEIAERIELPNQESIRTLGEKENYK